jgi:hypothetical protein
MVKRNKINKNLHPILKNYCVIKKIVSPLLKSKNFKFLEKFEKNGAFFHF